MIKKLKIAPQNNMKPKQPNMLEIKIKLKKPAIPNKNKLLKISNNIISKSFPNFIAN